MKKHTITVFETTFLDRLKIMLMLWLFRYKLERHGLDSHIIRLIKR